MLVMMMMVMMMMMMMMMMAAYHCQILLVLNFTRMIETFLIIFTISCLVFMIILFVIWILNMIFRFYKHRRHTEDQAVLRELEVSEIDLKVKWKCVFFLDKFNLLKTFICHEIIK